MLRKDSADGKAERKALDAELAIQIAGGVMQALGDRLGCRSSSFLQPDQEFVAADAGGQIHHAYDPARLRSDERRVGKEGVSTGSSRWSPDPKKKNNNKHQ